MGLIEQTGGMEYYRISLGALRRNADEGEEGAVKRTYKDKDTGEEITKTEIVKKGVSGFITGVSVRDGDYGEQLYIEIEDVDKFVIQVPWGSRYARQFLEKLPNIKPNEEVALIPYDFTKDGKRLVGLSVVKNYNTDVEEKVRSFFVEYSEDGKFMGAKHEYPYGEDGMSKDEFRKVGIDQMIYLRKNVVNRWPFTDDQGGDKPEEKTDDKSEEKDDLPF